MSTTTTNYGLMKPDTTDPILIGQLNDNMDTIDAALKENADAIDVAKLGIKYKGEVNYYSDLPSTGNEVGDAYTVKYAGSSGTTPDGTEYVWGAVSGTNQWINFSKDSYTKAEVDALLSLKANIADIPTPSTGAPAMDGTAAAGTSTDYARADHVHPSDTSRASAASEAEDRAALIELVDGGAKNIADMSKSTFTSTQKDGVTVTLSGDSITASGNSGTGTNNFFNVYYKTLSDVLIPSGMWTAVLIGTGIENFRVEIYDSTKPDIIKGDFGQPLTFTIAEGVTGSYARITTKPSSDCTGSFKLLICSSAAWDISQAYVPYRPPYQELYDMVKALQAAT